MTEELENLLRTIDKLKAEMSSILPLDACVQEQIARRFYIDWTYHSCNLEGNSYTRGETEKALLFDRPAAGKPGREYREVIGHGKAIKVIEELARSATPLTESDIKELNKMALGEESYESPAITQDGRHTNKTIIPGSYKTLPNHVRTATGEIFRYADPIDVVPRMAELLSWYRAEEERKIMHPAVLAAEFHFRFVMIHPFDDGNGRIARILMNYVLLRNEYPIVVIPTEEKDRYIASLEYADVGDMEPFYRYIVTREIESQNLWLRGARGESMEDVEKEAASEQPLPSLSASYDIAIKAYGISRNRIDYWRDNLDKILSWGTPISLIILGKAISSFIGKSVPYYSLLSLVIASGLALWAFLIAWRGKQKADNFAALPMPPQDLLEKWAILSDDGFKIYAIRNASVHMPQNDIAGEKYRNSGSTAIILFVFSDLFGALAFLTAT